MISIHEILKNNLFRPSPQTIIEKHDLYSLERIEFFSELNAVEEICRFGRPRMHKYLVDLKYYLLGIAEMHDFAKDEWFDHELSTVIKICNFGWPRVKRYLQCLRASLKPDSKNNLQITSTNVLAFKEGRGHV